MITMQLKFSGGKLPARQIRRRKIIINSGVRKGVGGGSTFPPVWCVTWGEKLPSHRLQFSQWKFFPPSTGLLPPAPN